jgi:biotin transporter BioY
VVILPITLQVPALLLTALVCGPRSGMLAAVAYLSLGLMAAAGITALTTLAWLTLLIQGLRGNG